MVHELNRQSNHEKIELTSFSVQFLKGFWPKQNFSPNIFCGQNVSFFSKWEKCILISPHLASPPFSTESQSKKSRKEAFSPLEGSIFQKLWDENYFQNPNLCFLQHCSWSTLSTVWPALKKSKCSSCQDWLSLPKDPLTRRRKEGEEMKGGEEQQRSVIEEPGKGDRLQEWISAAGSMWAAQGPGPIHGRPA